MDSRPACRGALSDGPAERPLRAERGATPGLRADVTATQHRGTLASWPGRRKSSSKNVRRYRTMSGPSSWRNLRDAWHVRDVRSDDDLLAAADLLSVELAQRERS